ncbi:MAG: type II toxin-antitoxin system death-on-curing family toxin [Alphaproteobacteria bacterium]|nr:type II toxin-antitoxin system death-on-curing family toxin [Alphaproteobacteria bacterium]
MPNEPNWLPIEAVIKHNRLEVEATGEGHFVREPGLLESALARPRNFFGYGEEDIVVLAVTLMAGIAQAHAFEQGNKRTAFAAMRLFLRANGYDTSFDDTVSWAEEIIALVEHRTTEADFVRTVRPFVVER